MDAGLVTHSPFATGANAAAVGLAIGFAIQETAREDELPGESRRQTLRAFGL